MNPKVFYPLYQKNGNLRSQKHGFRLSCISFIALQAIFAGQLAAAPLDTGFALAPKESASQAEKDAAYQEARSRLLAAAGKYEHTPYRYGGKDRKGLDCSGLVALSFLDALGISVPRSAENLYSWVEKVPIDNAQPGDLVFFRTTKTNKISHVGIFTGDGRFIHSASEGPVTGVIYSRLDEKYWSRTYAGAGRAFPAVGIYDSADRENALTTSQRERGKEKTSAFSWLGVAGLTLSPFAVKIARTDLAPYAEIAWQSYLNNSSDRNIAADLAAGFRFSTGLRVTWYM